jgi:hypothetical protein
MESTAAALAGATAFARAMRPDLPAVEKGLASLRAALAEAGVAYALVGGVAVLHHGYVRATRDLDLLISRDALERALPALTGHGFERVAELRLRHAPSAVDVDLLFAGEPRPRPGAPPYPDPSRLERSPRESDVVALPGLVELKLVAGRHQDTADVVALLKPLDDGDYLALESALPASLRSSLVVLRRDALEELALEKRRP